MNMNQKTHQIVMGIQSHLSKSVLSNSFAPLHNDKLPFKVIIKQKI